MSAASPPKTKRVPVRTCVVCREKAGKRQLIRLVRTETGLQIDPSGKMSGRGAYLCDNGSCWERAIHGDILNQALRMTLSTEDREKLLQAKPQS